MPSRRFESDQEAWARAMDLIPRREREKFFDEMYEIISALGEYVRAHEIADVILLDRSARPAGVALLTYFSTRYPGEKRPRILFTNPSGYKTIESTTPRSPADMIRILQGISERPNQDMFANQAELEVAFRNTYAELLADKDKPVMVFDTCIHSGGTVHNVLELLKSQGFRDVRFGAVSTAHLHSSEKIPPIDFTVPEPLMSGCHPFGPESLISRDYGNVTAAPNIDDLEDARLSREWHARIIKEMRTRVSA